MRGTMLRYSAAEGRGIISGDDGKRYRFAATQWQSKELLDVGLPVDFLADGEEARDVYLDPRSMVGWWAGLYRSSDEKMLAGVCAGVAHKFGVGKLPARVVPVLVPIWPIWLVLYLLAALTWPQRPTREA